MSSALVNTATLGGGVSPDDGYFPPQQRELSGRGESDGAAGYIAEGGSLVLSNSTIASNVATRNGGGIYLGRYEDGYDPDTQSTTYASSTIPLSSTIVADNTAAGAANDLDQIAGSTRPAASG